MAKKRKNERVVLENIELQPQVIGYTYKKKSNIGRVLIIFVAFLLAIYFINDISVYINKLLGKNSASTIKEGTSNKPIKKPVDEGEAKEVVYNIYQNGLSFEQDEMLLNNFNYNNGILTFDIENKRSEKIDKTEKKYFIETYTENKTLLDRKKVDIKIINGSAKVSFSININSSFYYLVLIEKSINDYPIVKLNNDEIGKGTITCIKDGEKIEYIFLNDELNEIKHTINNNNVNDSNYYQDYTSYKNKSEVYNKYDGVTSTFNGTVNGFTAIFSLNLGSVNMENITDNYYFKYKEVPKVVKFEMGTYGFNCS